MSNHGHSSWGSTTDDRPQWAREMRDRVNEDVLRVLDRPVIGSGSDLLQARLRGLQQKEKVAAYHTAEKLLGDPDTEPHRQACPRDRVLTILNDRMDALDREGDLDERLPDDPDPVPAPDRREPIRRKRDGTPYRLIQKRGRTMIRELDPNEIDDELGRNLPEPESRALADGGRDDG